MLYILCMYLCTLCCSLGYTCLNQDTVSEDGTHSHKKMTGCHLPLTLAYSDLSNIWKKAECYHDEDLFHYSTYTLRENHCYFQTWHFLHFSKCCMVPTVLVFLLVICVFISVRPLRPLKKSKKKKVLIIS